MTKTDFIRELAKNMDVAIVKAKEVYDAFEATLVEATKENDEVNLTGLFKITKQQVEAREFRNPQNGDVVTKEAHTKVKCKLGKLLKDAVL